MKNYRIILFLIAFIYTISANGQQSQRNLSAGMGVFRSLVFDEKVSNYLQKGTSVFERLQFSLEKVKIEHRVTLQFASPELTSAVGKANLSTNYFSLQFASLFGILHNEKFFTSAGPSFYGRAFVRNMTGEIISAVEASVKAVYSFNHKTKTECLINIPIMAHLVHQGYSISLPKQEFVSWSRFYSFQVQTCYLVSLSSRADFAVGYNLSFYKYGSAEITKVVNQQYSCELRFKF